MTDGAGETRSRVSPALQTELTEWAASTLQSCRHWVFDMDGTLTVAVHDFPAIKRALGIPQDDDILHHLAALPADEAAAKHAWLLEHERELALGSVAAPGAVELVHHLHGRGCRLGILTRNAHELALLTLECCARLEDSLRQQAPMNRPHNIDSVFHDSPEGRQGRPAADHHQPGAGVAGVDGGEGFLEQGQVLFGGDPPHIQNAGPGGSRERATGGEGVDTIGHHANVAARREFAHADRRLV